MKEFIEYKHMSRVGEAEHRWMRSERSEGRAWFLIDLMVRRRFLYDFFCTKHRIHQEASVEHKGSEIIIINYVVRPGRMCSIVLMDSVCISECLVVVSRESM